MCNNCFFLMSQTTQSAIFWSNLELTVCCAEILTCNKQSQDSRTAITIFGVCILYIYIYNINIHLSIIKSKILHIS